LPLRNVGIMIGCFRLLVDLSRRESR